MRRAFFCLIVGTFAAASAGATGPTPVPSVRPGTAIGATPVSEGRWSAGGALSRDESFLTFVVRNRRVEEIKFHVMLSCKTTETGHIREVPFTTSSAAGSEAREGLRVLALDARGHGEDILAFGGTDRWLNGQVTADLHGARGKISIGLSNAYGRATPLETCTGRVDNDVAFTGPAQPNVPQPCGYPWSPPDCSNSSPLTGPDTGSSGPAAPPRP